MKTKFAIWGVMFVLVVNAAFASAIAEEEACLSINSAQRSLSFPMVVAKESRIEVAYGEPARSILTKARGWPKCCSASEGSWYAILHARELLRCDPQRTLELAEQANRLVPNSPWIATVRARLLGTVEAAEQANAFAFDDIPAQLALASALLNENRLELAAKVLRRFNSRDYPEAAALKARMYLLKNDAKRAVTEAMIGKPVAPDLDSFQVSVRRTEPTSGLDWPWIDAQVEALAKAQLGKADEGARRLGGIPVGTLKELREAVAQNTKAAEQLMNAMSRLIEDTRDKGVPRDEMAVSLARLRVIADQTDLAAALVSASPKRLTPFCTGLSSLLWTLGSIQSRPTAHADRLRAMCTPKSPNATPVTEPMECSIP